MVSGCGRLPRAERGGGIEPWFGRVSGDYRTCTLPRQPRSPRAHSPTPSRKRWLIPAPLMACRNQLVGKHTASNSRQPWRMNPRTPQRIVQRIARNSCKRWLFHNRPHRRPGQFRVPVPRIRAWPQAYHPSKWHLREQTALARRPSRPPSLSEPWLTTSMPKHSFSSMPMPSPSP